MKMWICILILTSLIQSAKAQLVVYDPANQATEIADHLEEMVKLIAMVKNQISITGPKKAATRAVPRHCTANKATRMMMVSGNT